MSHPLVIAYHLVWTAYGWWLPNDPRGSSSKTIRRDVLAELGELHRGRKRVQPTRAVVRQFYERAESLLRHPRLNFDETARDEIAAAFAQVMIDQRYTCYSCAVMPDHVHLLMRKHKHSAEQMIDMLKDVSRERLQAHGHRSCDHPTWVAGSGWKVFLDHPDDVRRTIQYIERNPLPLGLPSQKWSFVTPYDGWPLHRGHNPNSPYATALRAVGRYPR